LGDSGSSAGNGGAVTFCAAGTSWRFAAIKGLVASGTANTTGAISFQNRADSSDATLTERMRIDSAGRITVNNSIGFGYGAGSGGTVTQATSKSTAVTLNKPSGQITMHNAALAAGTTVGFTCNNSTVTTTDVVAASFSGAFAFNYQVWTRSDNGSVSIYVRNISAGSLSEAVVINFCVLKGSAA